MTAGSVVLYVFCIFERNVYSNVVLVHHVTTCIKVLFVLGQTLNRIKNLKLAYHIAQSSFADMRIYYC
jgi:hypothetical protein